MFSAGTLEGATSGTAACATTDAFRAATSLCLGTTASLAGPWAAENLDSLVLLLLLLPAAAAVAQGVCVRVQHRRGLLLQQLLQQLVLLKAPAKPLFDSARVQALPLLQLRLHIVRCIRDCRG